MTGYLLCRSCSAAAFLEGKLKMCVVWDGKAEFSQKALGDVGTFTVRIFPPNAARQIIVCVFVFIKNNRKRIWPLPSIVFALSGVNICLPFAALFDRRHQRHELWASRLIIVDARRRKSRNRKKPRMRTQIKLRYNVVAARDARKILCRSRVKWSKWELMSGVALHVIII